MLLVLGTFRLAPETFVDARPAMARMIAASRAEAGCREYAYARDVCDAGLIRVTELWRDRAALDEHLATQHIAAWRSAWPPLGIGSRCLRVYEVGEARSK
jgi:quinol monooxygenase YgiN